MKFAGGFAVLISACVPVLVACGSADNPNFFSELGGAKDPAVGGTESANAGLNEGGASELGGSGGTLGGVAGRPSTGSAGNSSAGAADGGAMSSGGKGGGGKGGGGKGGGGKGGAGAGGSASAGAAGIATGGAGSGSAGTAGASAGTGGTSGSASGSGGGTSGWSGWSGSGGWNGWGGSYGGSGSGGAPVCPSTAPAKGEICDVTTPDSCFYAGQACSCMATNSGGFNSPKRWACYGDGAACPDTKPTAGASCKPNVDVECPYPGNDFCVCSGSKLDAHWVCQANQPACPANKPVNDGCDAVKTCSWGTNEEVACFCNGTRWACEGGF